MIHYQLRCSQDHEFDGWFKDSATFDRQAKRSLVECPVCGDTTVERALMAPAVATRDSAVVREDAAERRRNEEPPERPAVPPQIEPPAPVRVPAQVFALLQRMRAEVEKHCDYVGPAFADEARRIHRGESDVRGIYGEATPDEAEALADEGIDITNIPWVPRADG
jgi:hypothetical protein